MAEAPLLGRLRLGYYDTSSADTLCCFAAAAVSGYGAYITSCLLLLIVLSYPAVVNTDFAPGTTLLP